MTLNNPLTDEEDEIQRDVPEVTLQVSLSQEKMWVPEF